MAKRATVAEDLDTSRAVSRAAMEQRKRLAALIRARMAKPATAVEEELWQELKTEVSKSRLTFRS